MNRENVDLQARKGAFDRGILYNWYTIFFNTIKGVKKPNGFICGRVLVV
jgi:hypothetical protein